MICRHGDLPAEVLRLPVPVLGLSVAALRLLVEVAVAVAVARAVGNLDWSWQCQTACLNRAAGRDRTVYSLLRPGDAGAGLVAEVGAVVLETAGR